MVIESGMKLKYIYFWARKTKNSSLLIYRADFWRENVSKKGYHLRLMK